MIAFCDRCGRQVDVTQKPSAAHALAKGFGWHFICAADCENVRKEPPVTWLR